MIQGIYQSASGMDALVRMQETVANNLANVSTNGFKKEMIQIEKQEPGRLQVTGQLDMSNGSIRVTDVPTHLSLTSDGFFAVETDNGLAFTRNGDFQVDQSGRLVNTDGMPVMGRQGEILLESREFTVAQDGQIIVDGEVIDQLQIYHSDQEMRRIGHSLLVGVAPDDVQPIDASQVQIIQGALETSNVNPMESMIDMMMIMRLYEANQKALSQQDEATKLAATQIGRSV